MKGDIESMYSYGQYQSSIKTGMTPDKWKAEYAGSVPHWAKDTNPTPLAKQFLGNIPEGGSVLEVGTGGGRDAIFFAQNGRNVTGVDISSAALDIAKDNAKSLGATVDFRTANVEKLPFRDNEFDSLYTLSVIHSTDMSKSVPEIYRVVKPGGKVFIFLYKDTQYSDGRPTEDAVNLQDFLLGLKRIGFKVLESGEYAETKFDEYGEKHDKIIVLLQKGDASA